MAAFRVRPFAADANATDEAVKVCEAFETPKTPNLGDAPPALLAFKRYVEEQIGSPIAGVGPGSGTRKHPVLRRGRSGTSHGE